MNWTPLLFAVCLLAQAPAALAQSAGQPPSSGQEPGVQGEKDWVDNRWARSDVGPFLASNLEIAGARIAKALSIKVGAGDEGAVCFDTGACALRAGWLGGFLQMDPARFGLIRAPQIKGDLAFSLPRGPGWAGAEVRYSGLHLQGKRVVLEYQADETQVLDSPSLETRPGLNVFIRSLEIGPSDRPLKLRLADGVKNLAPGPGKNRPGCVAETEKGLLALVVVGAEAAITLEDRALIVTFLPHKTALKTKLLLWAGEQAGLVRFSQFAAGAGDSPEDLQALSKPGPARWLPELETVGQRGLDNDILAVDTLTVPYDNPWKALMFLAGVDFTPDGAAYVCSIHGDVWRVTGIDDKLGKLHWKRFATGLFQALGLKVRDGDVFVLGRDQITRLRDLDGDGEADYYENFCNLIETSTSGHDYVTSLEKDNAGNFYFVDPRGAWRVAPDGKKLDKLATGFRNPNGLGASPDGRVITVAPQQGEWTPSSVIVEVKTGEYYGYGGPKVTAERPLGYGLPLCWIPHPVDNSSGSQVWIPQNQWGPLGGQMLHLLWGRCGMMLALRSVVDGVPEGAVVPLPGHFLSGPNRASFNPRDSGLYVAGSAGWQTSSVKDGALQRVRFTGKTVFLPTAWHPFRNGLTVTFAEPLDRSSAEDAGSYAVRQWNYRYAAQYGSKDWSVADPAKEGRDEVQVKSARLLPDGKTVFLEIPNLQPVMQMEVKYSLNAAAGKPLRSQMWLTINKVDSASAP